jgi:predicted lipoprotein with Yx(FWY)xxD motif
MFRRALALGLLVASASLTACGASSSAGETGPGPASQAIPAGKAKRQKGPVLKVIASDYGRILADGHGRALYLFTADTGKGSECSGDCAEAWPPWIVKRTPRAGPSVHGGLIATVSRDDGRLQAAYKGQPLYYYVGDRSPGEVNCQAAFEFGGYWYVVRAGGSAVR